MQAQNYNLFSMICENIEQKFVNCETILRTSMRIILLILRPNNYLLCYHNIMFQVFFYISS